MSKKASPTTIGLFIVIGLALGVAGLILFGSGKLFSRQHRFILYFDASLKGLNPGAAVKIRGVNVGSVAEVLIHHNQAINDYSKPVIIQIDEKLVRAKTDNAFRLDDRIWVDNLIKQGLRGKLDAESLVTGVLCVDLEVLRNARSPVLHQLRNEYAEIPTVPTEIQELLANLAHLDIRGMSDKLNAILVRLDTSLSELNIRQINAGVTNLLASADRLVNSPDLTSALAELKHTLEDAHGLVKHIDGRVDPLVNSVTNTLSQAQETLVRLRSAIKDLAGLVEPDAPLRADLAVMLEQLGNTLNSVADLAEFLERNPNSLLTGRKVSKAKQ